ncbi:MAG: MFS transporter [Verrucomicrobiota bacterium]
MSTTQRPSSALRKNMRLSIVEGIVAMPLVFFTMPGNFMAATLATDVLNITENIYGIIASLPAWCNIIQLFAMPYMTGHASQKNICLAASWIHVACWTLLAFALPYIPKDESSAAIALMLVFFGASNFAFAIINISWTSWIQEWLPQKSRGKYLGRRNRILQIATVAFLITASQTIKSFNQNDLTQAFQWIIGGGVILRIVSIILQQRIFSPDKSALEQSGNLFSKIGIIYRKKNLFRFILFGGAFGLTASFMGPFFPIFMSKALLMTPTQIGYAVMIATVTGALAMPYWGKLSDEHGSRPVLIIALSIWMINGYLWYFCTPATHWVVYAIWATGGVFGSGFIFASFSLLLKLVPDEAKTAAISLNMAFTSLAGALSPVAGGYVIEWAERRYSDFLTVFHHLSAIHHTLILLTVLILFTVDEPKSSTIRQAVGSMRALRQAGAALGLSYLINYSFFKKKK